MFNNSSIYCDLWGSQVSGAEDPSCLECDAVLLERSWTACERENTTVLQSVGNYSPSSTASHPGGLGSPSHILLCTCTTHCSHSGITCPLQSIWWSHLISTSHDVLIQTPLFIMKLNFHCTYRRQSLSGGCGKKKKKYSNGFSVLAMGHGIVTSNVWHTNGQIKGGRSSVKHNSGKIKHILL